MTYKTAYWDEIAQAQSERDCTPEEIAEIESRKQPDNVRPGIRAAIRAERDRRKFNGVKVGAKWIHTDTYSRTQWMGMVMMGASVPSIEWTTMDGSSATTSQTLASQVFQATAALDSALFAHAKSLISTVDASPTPASVDIASGWPETFGEN
jgi:hypothetical protein